MTLYQKVASLRGMMGKSAWSTRIICELNYAASLSTAKGGKYDAIVDQAADFLLDAGKKDGGVLTVDTCKQAEELLLPLQKDAKSYRVHCVSHAHIDMNWMWGYQETTSVAVDTFRTVLDLMKEYPDFTFAQSQASTYQIIEEFAPEMIEEIKQRVHEGRWEVSASTWVENDKNMPNGESLARHILYTKRYLSKLLDIPAESMELDFEPDTFGHNISVPEVCQKGGVKYYYHCRGNDTEEDSAYRWRARTGAELLVWRDPHWYGCSIEPDMYQIVPQFCEKFGTNCYLSVYGVGDHGGGPTRRDLDRLITMGSWPIMPDIFFSTYSKFFHELEAFRDHLPLREGELNFVFTGCYTSQSRIKMANRIGEDRMFESEGLSAAAALLGGPRCNERLGKAWEQILFNHFHDILPGSGVIDTREYALGQFQRAMAAVMTSANCSMRTIAASIDTSALGVALDGDSTSEGSGVGFMVGADAHYGLPQAERGVGKKRVFHFFNSTQYDFDGVTELTVWDWNYDENRAKFADTDGNTIPYKITAGGSHYWGHQFKKFALHVKVPAFGYATYTLDELELANNTWAQGFGDRTDTYSDADLVMENDRIKAVFDHATMQLISLVDKATGNDVVALPAANFRLIMENTVHGMAAWRVGDYMTVQNLNETCNIRVYDINLGGLRKWIRYDLSFGKRSKMTVSVMLDDASSMLNFDVTVDFHEIGNGSGIPQLNFAAPVGYAVGSYRYDVPFGTIDRPAIDYDVPANSFAAALPADDREKASLMLISDTKYGFRGTDNMLALDLIRASYEPDPYPEYGVHHIRIGLGVTNGADNKTLFRTAAAFIHPLSACSARGSKGTLPLSGRLFTVEGNVHISSVKTPEDFDGLMIRLSDEAGEGARFTLTFAKPVAAAYDADINENILGDLAKDGCCVRAQVEPYAVKTILVKF